MVHCAHFSKTVTAATNPSEKVPCGSLPPFPLHLRSRKHCENLRACSFGLRPAALMALRPWAEPGPYLGLSSPSAKRGSWTNERISGALLTGSLSGLAGPHSACMGAHGRREWPGWAGEEREQKDQSSQGTRIFRFAQPGLRGCPWDSTGR